MIVQAVMLKSSENCPLMFVTSQNFFQPLLVLLPLSLGFTANVASAMIGRWRPCPPPPRGHGRWAPMFTIAPSDFVAPSRRSAITARRNDLKF